MNWIRYSIGNTKANATMPLSIGAPQVLSSGPPAGKAGVLLPIMIDKLKREDDEIVVILA